MKWLFWIFFSLGITLLLFGGCLAFLFPEAGFWNCILGGWCIFSSFIFLLFRKGQSRKKKIIVSLVGVLVFSVGILAFLEYFTGFLGIYSPLDRVVSAIKRTALANNFTIEYTLKEERGGKSYVEAGEIRYLIDKDTEDLTILQDDGDSATLIYENKQYDKSEKYANVSDADTDNFFDFYNKLSGKEEWEEIDWDYYLEELDLDESLKAERMDDFVEAVYDELIGSTRWQKKALGLKKNGNTYTFKPDMLKIYNDVVDLAKKQGVMTSEGKRELSEGEHEIKKDLKELDLSVSVTLQGRYVESIVIETNGDGEDEKYHVEICIFNINKTEISDGEMENFMDQINTLEKENRCPYCAKPRYEANHCQQCERQCDKCDSYGYINYITQYRGRYYCMVCCDGNCASCGKRLPKSAMYHHYGTYKCYECVY